MAMMKKVKKYIDYVLSLVSKAIREKNTEMRILHLNIYFIHVRIQKIWWLCSVHVPE